MVENNMFFIENTWDCLPYNMQSENLHLWISQFLIGIFFFSVFDKKKQETFMPNIKISVCVQQTVSYPLC